MLRSANGFDAQGLCGVEYRWLEREDVRGEAIDGWRALVGKIEVLEIEGNHFEVFKGDKIEANSTQMIQACKIIDGGTADD